MNRTLVLIILVLVGLIGGWALLTLGPGRGGWVWVGLSLVALLGLAGLNARNLLYKCPKCSHQYQIGLLTELFSAHRPNRGKHLRCPRCDRLGWAQSSPKTPVAQPPRNVARPPRKNRLSGETKKETTKK